MTWAILGFATLALGAITTPWLLFYKSTRREAALRDLLEAKDKLSDQYKHERDVAVADRDVKSAQLKEATDRLAGAEAQLRDLESRQVAKLKESDAQTVADVLSDTLAQPWKRVSPPVPRSGDSPAKDGLLDPFAVQPAAAAGTNPASGGDGKS